MLHRLLNKAQNQQVSKGLIQKIDFIEDKKSLFAIHFYIIVIARVGLPNIDIMTSIR